jgi:hypothetical protein
MIERNYQARGDPLRNHKDLLFYKHLILVFGKGRLDNRKGGCGLKSGSRSARAAKIERGPMRAAILDADRGLPLLHLAVLQQRVFVYHT